MAIKRNSINGVLIYSGTAADRATLTADDIGKGTEFWESDTRAKYRSDGTNWSQFEASGAAHVTEYPIKSYTIVSGAYLYEGFAAWGSATSAAAWAMHRTPTAGGATQRADGGAFSQIADNYASLTYAD